MRKFTLSLLVIFLSVFLMGPNVFGQAKHAKTTDIKTVQAPAIQKTTPSGPTDTDMYSCDFEDIDDWSMDFSPWTVVDNDGLPTYGMTGVTWPGSGDPQAYICFNPATTDPPLTDDDEIQPHSGEKFGACIAAVPDGAQGNDDWFISAMVSVNDGASFNFWAKSYTDQYGLERFNVAVSTTTPDPAEFTVISGATYIEAPMAWTEYNFDLSAYAGQDIYVAIQCVTYDAFVFMIDDLVIDPGTAGGAGFCDDFDSYTAGDFLCTQSPYWTTWDNNPGGDYDAYITDAMAQTAPNSVDIDIAVLESDLVTDLGQTTTGVWSISLEIMIPDDGTSGGYWNIMQDMELFGAANEWGFQIYYKSDGTGYMQDANFTQYDFTYTPGEWTLTEVVIDLDNALAQLYVDETMFAEWQWDIAGPNMLGAVDIYAAADGNDNPKFYIDSFCFSEMTPPQPSACEDFDSYMPGDFVAVVVEGWTTWSNNPGSAEDAPITDVVSNSPSNSFIIEGGTDLLQLFDDANITSGKWHYSNMMYVADGFTGYFNLQKDVIPGEEWGFQVMFDSDGNATVDAGAAAAVVFPFTFDTWHMNELVVDLENDLAEYWLNGELIIEWAWSLGTFGTPGAMTLGGANYFANPGITDPKAYYDDVCFEEWVEPANCDDFDSYTAGEFLAVQSDLWTTWDNNPGGDYDGYITDEMAETAPNSLSIDASVIESDLVYDLGQKMAGGWAITLDIYVPDGGYGAYYNVMQDMELFGAGNEWGFQVYFKSDGTGYMYDAAFTTYDFTYNVGEWNHSAVYVDLDIAWAQYYINGSMVAEWQWDIDGPNMLGAVDIYAAADGNDLPKCYIDNFCYDPHTGIGIENPATVVESITANIYPNPARDQITIVSNNIIDEVSVYNNMGQLVYSGEFNNEQITVNTSSFITGMYIVQVRSGDAVEVRKLIIE